MRKIKGYACLMALLCLGVLYGAARAEGADKFNGKDPYEIKDILTETLNASGSGLTGEQKTLLDTREYHLSSIVPLVVIHDSMKGNGISFAGAEERSQTGIESDWSSFWVQRPPYANFGMPAGVTGTLMSPDPAENGMAGDHIFVLPMFYLENRTPKREVLFGKVKSADGRILMEMMPERTYIVPNDPASSEKDRWNFSDTKEGYMIYASDIAMDIERGGTYYCAIVDNLHDNNEHFRTRVVLIEQNVLTSGANSTKPAFYYPKPDRVRLDKGALGARVAAAGEQFAVAYGEDDGKDVYYNLVVYAPGQSNELFRWRSQKNDRGHVGIDVAAGDFDGDGLVDLALVVDDDQHAKVYLFTRKSGEWQEAGNYYDHVGHNLSNNRLGFLAEAGDIDGDGKDELVFVTRTNDSDNNLYIVTIDAGNIDSPKRVDNITTSYLVDDEDEHDLHMCKSVGIALAPVRGTANPEGRTLLDLVVHYKKKNRESTAYMIHAPKLSSGKFAGFENPGTDSDSHKTLQQKSDSRTYVGLLAGDFAKESLILGEPQHLVYSEYGNLVSAIQAPPAHYDWIAAPGEDDSAPSLHNYGYSGANESVYTSAHTEGGATNYSIEPSLSSSLAVAANVSAGFGNIGKASFGGSLGLAIEASYKYMHSTTSMKKMVAQERPSFLDSVTTMRSDIHIWRYPIIGSAYTAEEAGGSYSLDDRTQYVQCTMPFEQVTYHADSVNVDNYAPLHEEGNLFSYPVSVARIKGYDDQGAGTLAGGNDMQQIGESRQVTLTLSDTVKSDHTVNVKGKIEESGSLSVGVKVPLVLEGDAKLTQSLKLALAGSYMSSSTVTDEDSFTVSMPSFIFGVSRNIAPYAITPVVFSEKASGTLHFGYAVHIDEAGSDAGSGLWASPASVYKRYSDPALNLPGKFYLKTQGNATLPPTIEPNPQSTATKIRGLSIVDGESGEGVDGNLLQAGKRYEIIVPIANYSFVDMRDSVPVAFYYTDDRVDVDGNPLGSMTEIGRTTLAPIPGWKAGDDGRNKSSTSFAWTVPTSLNGAYRLYVEIDPDDVLTEVHEKWTPETPGGNNLGYMRFGVGVQAARTRGDGPTPAARLAAKRAASPEENFEVTLFNGITHERLTKGDIRSAFEDRGQLPIAGTLKYVGDEPLTKLRILVENSSATASRPTFIAADRLFPLVLPGQESRFSFVLDPRKLDGATLDVYASFEDADGDLIRTEKEITVFETGLPGGGSDSEGGGSGGCASGQAGFGVLMALSAAAALKRRR